MRNINITLLTTTARKLSVYGYLDIFVCVYAIVDIGEIKKCCIGLTSSYSGFFTESETWKEREDNFQVWMGFLGPFHGEKLYNMISIKISQAIHTFGCIHNFFFFSWKKKWCFFWYPFFLYFFKKIEIISSRCYDTVDVCMDLVDARREKNNLFESIALCRYICKMHIHI